MKHASLRVTPMGAPGHRRKSARLLGRVPARVARADAIGDREPGREGGLAQEVVGVLGQALDGGRPHAVEHHGQRQLAGVEERGRPRARWSRRRCTMPAPTASSGPTAGRCRECGARSPPASIEIGAPGASTGDGAVDEPRRHERLAERQRLVEERPARRGVGTSTPGLVALEAQDLVAVDAERQAVEDDGRWTRGRRCASVTAARRERTTSAMRRMCSGPEPQQPPTMLHPASSSAG